MAITTIAEASAVNTLLRFMLPGIDRYGLGQAPTSAQAKDAAVLLTKSANRLLGAGITERDIALQWQMSARRSERKEARA
jgi:hypothetical protein